MGFNWLLTLSAVTTYARWQAMQVHQVIGTNVWMSSNAEGSWQYRLINWLRERNRYL